jgi:hypothetical protein
VGGAVPWSDTGHPAHHPHSVRRGRAAAGWSNSVGMRFLGRVRGSPWKGFPFDSGAYGAPGH